MHHPFHHSPQGQTGVPLLDLMNLMMILLGVLVSLLFYSGSVN